MKYKEREGIVIFGAGLAGLTAGYALCRGGRSVVLLESASAVGGLAKTIEHGGFRFDLGGHRFFTRDKEVEDFILDFMGSEMRLVPRKSKIFMRDTFFDYPLKPLNALFGMGPLTTLRIILSYGLERAKSAAKTAADVSLEDWVVRKFGRTTFNLYFREYSEKVWGIECSRISAEWVAQRISGLSLGVAIKDAFVKMNGRDVPTLSDTFMYPSRGIGRISEKFRAAIDRENRVVTNARVCRIRHGGGKVDAIEVRNGSRTYTVRGEEYLATIPITDVVSILDPAPPPEVSKAASRLRYRDLIVSAVMVDSIRVTDQSWIYIPDKNIPFGRLHEPKNWSPEMAPPGKTVLVAEYFCRAGDDRWRLPDELIGRETVENLRRLGFLKADKVLDTAVVRVPKAYPLFEVGFQEHCRVLEDHLESFSNLHSIGRNGLFRYHNMDHVIRAGLEMARKIGFPEGGKEQAEGGFEGPSGEVVLPSASPS